MNHYIQEQFGYNEKKFRISIIILSIILLLIAALFFWWLYDYNTYTKEVMSNELLVEDEYDKNSKSYNQFSNPSYFEWYMPFPDMVTVIQTTLVNIDSEKYKMLVDDVKIYYVDSMLNYTHNIFSVFKTKNLNFEISIQKFYNEESGVSYGQSYAITTDMDLNLISEEVEGLNDLSYDYLVEARDNALDFFGENVFK